MKQAKTKSHIIICNWNYKAQDLIREFRSDNKTANAPIVILAEEEYKPVDDEDVLFVRGDPTAEEALKKAGLREAETVIVLLDENVEVYSRDAKVILTALTIESMRPDVYICAELLDPENVRHAQRARADEILVTGEMSSKLLARSAIDHGISHVVSELVCGQYGNSFYKISAPRSFLGKPVGELFAYLKDRHNITLISLERDEQHISNPPSDTRIQEGDYLVVLAEQRPQVS